MTTCPETELRKLWTAEGVPQARQDDLIAQVKAKAAPGARIGPFSLAYITELTPAGEQTVIPGCERNHAPGPRQLDLFG